MENENSKKEERTLKINKEKLILAQAKKMKLHITLRDSSWRNGFVIDLNSDFFMFDDTHNGKEPIFYIEVSKVDPYVNLQ